MAGFTYGPYGSEAIASVCLSRCTDAVFGDRYMGQIWAEDGGAKVLRPPHYDDDGYGLVLIAILHGLAPPRPDRDSASGKEPAHGFLYRLMEAIGKSQIQQAEMQQAEAQAVIDLSRSALASAKEFLERHEIPVRGITVAFDALGVIAGGAVLMTIGPELAAGALGAAAFAALGGIAGGASAALLATDGLMLGFELTANEAGKKWLEEQSSYQWVQAVAPLLLLPDLLVNLPRAIVSSARAAREIRALPGEVRETEQQLASARDLLDAHYETEADRTTAAWRNRLLELRGKSNKLAEDLSNAQKKLEKAENELTMARIRDFPAWGGSIYSEGLYAVAPPTLTERWMTRKSDGGPSRPTRELPLGPNAWNSLLPDRCAVPSALNLEVRVGIAQRPTRRKALQFRDWDTPKSPLQFRNWDGGSP